MSGPFAPVAVTDRSGLDECWHEGAVVGLAADGSSAVVVGDPAVVVYPRSCAKPFQAVAMLRAGLRLPPRLLALAAASHTGERRHAEAVREILATVGLHEEALRNTADLPVAPADVVRVGGVAAPIHMNCSGKHAAMVVTCRINGWDIETYLDPQHPLQQRVAAVVAEFTGEPVAHIGVDGCGAPVHAVSLAGLARGFRRVALTEPEVFAAMTGHPEMVGGTGHHVTGFMQGVPGLLVKDGADGVYAAAHADGRAVALKIADGTARVRPTVLAAALRALGVDVEGAREVWDVAVLGHGRPVGRVRSAF